MSASIEDVGKELEKLGYYAEAGSREHDGRTWQFLNVFQDGERAPVATVWPPKGDDGWTWGPSFQWGTYADADAQAVAFRICETL